MKHLHLQLFLVITAIFLAYVCAFFYYEYAHETAYKQQLAGVRVTVVDTLGNVVWDTEEPSTQLHNHKDRPEVQQALREGYGFDIRRTSETNGATYFYSATYDPETNQIIRSALPYPSERAITNPHTRRTILITALAFLLLTIVLYVYTRQVARRVDLTISDYKAQVRHAEAEKMRIKHDLTQNTAHELKTPAASINGYLDTLLHHPDLPPEQRQHFLERTYAQSQRMTQLLQDMSTLIRLDAEATNLPSAPRPFASVDLLPIIRQAMEDVAPMLLSKHMAIQLSFTAASAPSAPASFTASAPASLPIHGEADLLYSIFRNILDNAITYSAGTSIRICCTLPTDASQRLLFAISDDGVGVPNEHLAHIFERFYRVDKSRSRNLGGTGLGLAIVKNAVQLHGGQIEALPTQPHGLTIRFSLPTKVL